MRLAKLRPMLNVRDLQRSLAFYREALGFELASAEDKVEAWRWCALRSGEVELMLSENGGPAQAATEENFPAILYFYPDDVEAVRARVLAAGYDAGELELTFYGMLEFRMQDPDGHQLWFGTDA